MSKYASFDQYGRVIAFYDEAIHGPRLIPIYGDMPEPTEDNPTPARPYLGEQLNPDCTIPDDAVEITEDQYADLLDNQATRRCVDGQVVEYTPPPPIPTVEYFRIAIQSLIDAKAQEKQYDSGATLASYVNSTIEQWSDEATAFVAWRDAVWLYALAELDKVQSGARSQPTVEAFLAELPELEWDSGEQPS